MIYRAIAEPFEATPPYWYACDLCKEPIKGPYTINSRYAWDKGYPVKGQSAVDVLHDGQIITVHETCNH